MSVNARNFFHSKGSQLETRLSSGIRWRWGVLAALAMALLSLWPQIYLWGSRGAEWNGSFAHSNYDEDAYAAYVNGLIAGRPRRSDPLIESKNGELPPESIFSIQFTQPLLLAAIARTLGLSTSSVFIILLPLTAFLSTLALFWLLSILTDDVHLATVGPLFILCFGTLAGWGGKVLPVLHLGATFNPGLFFLRRYQPGLSFPLFFIFVLLVWCALTRDDRLGRLAAYAAGLAFAILVFTYYFLWTAAAGWLLIVTSLWLLAYRSEWRWLFKRLTPLAAIAGLALAGYALLLARIDPATSNTQVLEFTHAPDFMRAPEPIALVAVLLVWRSIKVRGRRWAEPMTLLTLSLALLPFLLFNQHVVTGRSLQPIHYELFVGNYVALLALTLAIFVLNRRPEIAGRTRVPRALVVLGLISFFLGVVEINYDTRKRREHNRKRDEFAAVANRLRLEAAKSGRDINDREVVFSPDIWVVADNLATFAPQAVLWATHAPVMPMLSESDRNQRFFLYLYYSDVTPEVLEHRLRNKSYSEIFALFGFDRHLKILTSDFKPVTETEILDKVRQYEEFTTNIDWFAASRPLLSWVVIEPGSDIRLHNLDRWYLRESEEVIGKYRLIRVAPRTVAEHRVTVAP